jgi:CheY-like chemotaxis protein
VGTSISLYLPRLDHKLPCAVQPKQSAEQLRGGTILAVDDDPDVLEVATAAIESFGYTVHAAADGQSALEVLKRDIPIDLLFTDVVMPLGLSGVALAREACQLRPELRVLLASGYPRTLIEQSEGVDDSMELIAKPYALATLSQRLRTLALGQPN